MKIIICGAGKVGTSIAKHLVNQKNDVTVIDRSDELINKLREKVDLKTIVGSASNPSVLKEAGGENVRTDIMGGDTKVYCNIVYYQAEDQTCQQESRQS